MRSAYSIWAVGLASLLIAGFVSADGMTAGAPRVAMLSGAAEAPGPGDSDGSGIAMIRLNVGRGRVCWDLSWSDIGMTTGAHIHRAPAGVPGGVVVPLSVTMPQGCADGVDPALIEEIVDFPERFYVNVHTTDFPAGAIRGQLSVPGQA